jgi:hypothetical protein
MPFSFDQLSNRRSVSRRYLKSACPVKPFALITNFWLPELSRSKEKKISRNACIELKHRAMAITLAGVSSTQCPLCDRLSLG